MSNAVRSTMHGEGTVAGHSGTMFEPLGVILGSPSCRASPSTRYSLLRSAYLAFLTCGLPQAITAVLTALPTAT